MTEFEKWEKEHGIWCQFAAGHDAENLHAFNTLTALEQAWNLLREVDEWERTVAAGLPELMFKIRAFLSQKQGIAPLDTEGVKQMGWHKDVVKKINELIKAVNELHDDDVIDQALKQFEEHINRPLADKHSP